MPEEATGEELAWSVEEKPAGVLADQAEEWVYAARTGDIAQVKQYLEEGVPVDAADGSGWTALRWAASEGHEDVVAMLIDAGAAQQEFDAAAAGSAGGEGSGGGSSLHWAAYK